MSTGPTQHYEARSFCLFTPKWWAFSGQQMTAASLASTTLTSVCLCSLALRLDGMSIGGVMSAACVAIRLAAEQRDCMVVGAASLHPVRNGCYIMEWLRYVDDVVTLSHQLRCTCQSRILEPVYSELVSEVFLSDQHMFGHRFDSVDIDFRVLSSGVFGAPQEP